MRLKLIPFLVLLCIGGFFSCQKDCPPIPSIEFVSISTDYMVQNGTDSLFLKFKFTDGDGNLGSNTDNNIFIKDSRTGQTVAEYKIPDYLGTSTNNSCRTGEISLVVYSQCCIYPDSSSCYYNQLFPTNTMNYQIQIQDQAGNLSNIIESDPITLDCQL